jgi:O-antigen ligase/polysaccharide polymerase Wzy-like membrane protein
VSSVPLPTAALVGRRVAAGERGTRGRPSADPAVDSPPRLPVVMTAAAVVVLPVTVPRGPGNVGPADVLIVLAVGAWLYAAATSGERLRFPYALGFGLLMLGGAIGGLAGPAPSAGVLALMQDMLLAAWACAVVNVCRTPYAASLILRTWAYSSIGWAIVLFAGLAAGVSALTGQIPTEGSRTALTFADPNVFANYLFISAMIVCATRRPRRRWQRAAAYVLLIAALVTTGSNSGLVSVAVGVGVAVVLGVCRRASLVSAIATAACLTVALGGAVSLISLHSIQQRAYTSGYAVLRDGIGRGQASVNERSKVLSESLGLYADGGAAGEGPVSTKPRLEAAQVPYPKEAHDDYFAALLERGLIGAVGLAILIASLVTRTGSLIRRAQPFGPAVLPTPSALVGAVAGTMVTMTVYELLHVRHVWGLFATVAACSIWGRAR